MDELNDVEKKIFDSIVQKHKGPVDETYLKKIIRLANTEGDGYKRICRMGEEKSHLVPIEDIILYGVKSQELDKYPVEQV